MASNINTTTINTSYPIAGQDNDSQGFRDNFSNTNSNFVAAKAEIEDIKVQSSWSQKTSCRKSILRTQLL